MLSTALVVARYQEDLSWLRRVPAKIAVTVYDKSGEAGAEHPLPNEGREAHTYLHHLVDRYDNLAERTVFCQGRPFDHVPDFHRTLRNLASGKESIDDFKWLGFVIDRDDRTGSLQYQKWSKNPEGHSLPMDRFWGALWEKPVPETFTFYLGAHFIVTRDQVRQNPIEFYRRALDVSKKIPDAAHCFERTWDRVFGVHGIPSEYRDKALPLYLRPVRRLGITWDQLPFSPAES